MSYTLHGFGEFYHDSEDAMFQAEVITAPCRTIAITPEILAEEAAKEAAREVHGPDSWARFKATLSEDNLRKARVRNIHGGTEIVTVTPRDLKRSKATRGPGQDRPVCTCGKALWKGSTQCRPCWKAARTAEAQPKLTALCEDCGGELAKGTRAGVKHCRVCRYKHREKRPVGRPRKAAPPTDVAQTHTTRSVMKVPQFTVLTPVQEADTPVSRQVRGRTSPYLPLFEQLRMLKTREFLPIEVPDTKVGYAAAAALRKMAKAANQSLEQRNSTDGLKFYFRLAVLNPRSE